MPSDSPANWRLPLASQRISRGLVLTSTAAAFVVLLACAELAHVRGDRLPRVTDEFSYLVLSNALATGAVFQTPSLPAEFIDAPHVLTSPVYASKYFPAQSVFLAVGEAVWRRPVVGVWLSAACATFAMCWMLGGFMATRWAILGTALFALQYGIYSYWSQSYWGGMVPAMAGALLLGAAPRLVSSPSHSAAAAMAFGVALLVSSRPLEGAIVTLPIGVFLIRRYIQEPRPWGALQIAAGPIVILAAVVALLAAYSAKSTGRWWLVPYVAHEARYQNSPPLVFMSEPGPRVYSSTSLRRYYERELDWYREQTTGRGFLRHASVKLAAWWMFYWSIPLACPLIIGALRRGGFLRVSQWLLVGCYGVILAFGPVEGAAWGLFALIVAGCQWMVTYRAYSSEYVKLALAMIGCLLVENLCLKYGFAHYFAPACGALVLVQTWSLASLHEAQNADPSSRSGRLRFSWAGATLVGILALELIFFAMRVADGPGGLVVDDPKTEGLQVAEDDFSKRRGRIVRELNGRNRRQLVFVRYGPEHVVAQEWVYNHADLGGAHITWVRELSNASNEALMNARPDHEVWVIDADDRRGVLMPLRTWAQDAPRLEVPQRHRLAW
jgi:hypothetical protein